MNVLVITATRLEANSFAKLLEAKALPTAMAIDWLVGGVGLSATSYALTKSLLTRRPDLVIQAGIAGGFDPARIGDTVVVKEDRVADLGVWENDAFHDLYDLGLNTISEETFAQRWLENPWNKLLALTGLEAVRGISVNEITTSAARIQWYQQNTQPVVESMEGAALHDVCLRENVPFLQIRSVSNLVGDRNKRNWKMTEAIRELNEQLILLLKKLNTADETYFRI